MSDFHEVPVVDLRGIYSSERDDRAAVAKAIGDACRNVGFFYVKNHNVPEELMEKVYHELKRFFDTPMEEKMKIAMSNKPQAHRGYFPFLEENADEKGEGDLKEGIDIGKEDNSDTPQELHGQNQWPSDLPGWKEVMEEYFKEVERLGMTLLTAFAIDLGLGSEDYFHQMFNPGMMLLRLLHYPTQNVNESNFNSKQIGCGVHTDYGCVTILSQDATGLQVRNRQGDWVDAPPIPNHFVINLGDAMERWTNGLYKATPHRVLNVTGKARYSIPFFFEPNYDTLVKVLPSCITEERPAQYSEVLYGVYLKGRLDATFNYRK